MACTSRLITSRLTPSWAAMSAWRIPRRYMLATRLRRSAMASLWAPVGRLMGGSWRDVMPPGLGSKNGHRRDRSGLLMRSPATALAASPRGPQHLKYIAFRSRCRRRLAASRCWPVGGSARRPTSVGIQDGHCTRDFRFLDEKRTSVPPRCYIGGRKQAGPGGSGKSPVPQASAR
jgi:hypothetical protein